MTQQKQQQQGPVLLLLGSFESPEDESSDNSLAEPALGLLFNYRLTPLLFSWCLILILSSFAGPSKQSADTISLWRQRH